LQYALCSVVIQNVLLYLFVCVVITEHRSYSDSYDSEVKDISVDESCSNAYMTEAEITDSQ
jgi:hypothetical protein